jgi:hypothetical protein
MLFGESLDHAYKSNVANKMNPNPLPVAFPPVMMDGLTVTAAWQPEAVVNNHLIKEAGIDSNWKYRQFLTKNATKIMQKNADSMNEDIGFVNHYSKGDLAAESTNLSGIQTPRYYKSMQESDNILPASDLKMLYLSREQLNAQKIAPAMSQEQLLKFIQHKQMYMA